MLKLFINSIREMSPREFSVVILRDGEKVYEYFGEENTIHGQYSITKSFMSTAVGIAIDDGLMSQDDNVMKYFESEVDYPVDAKLHGVLVKHLLTHTMGNSISYMHDGDNYGHGANDWLEYIMKQPLDYYPGEKFAYTNSTYYLLSRIVEKVTGKTTRDFLEERLFAPLGIVDYEWESCPMGHTIGGTGLSLKTGDLAKFGQLYLQEGIWNGNRIFSGRWVENTTARIVLSNVNIYYYGYGFRIVNSGEFYYGAGLNNKLVLIHPGLRLVVAINSYVNDFKALMNIVNNEIIKELLNGSHPV